MTPAFTPPSGMLITFWRLSKNGRAAAKRYLDKRGLPPPVINWGAIDELWRRARGAAASHPAPGGREGDALSVETGHDESHGLLRYPDTGSWSSRY